MLGILQTIGSWLRAIPGPTEHWAAILAAWAWPTALLIAVFYLREPLRRAADKIAERFDGDDIEVGSLLKITKNTSVTTLDEGAVTKATGTVEERDATVVEALLEFAGESDAHANRLLGWIAEYGGATLDAEDFLTDINFANLREKAYIELVGAKNG